MSNVLSKLGTPQVSCLPTTTNLTSGKAGCLVGLVDSTSPAGTLPSTCMPQCSASCYQAWAEAAQPVGAYGTGGATGFAPAIVSACTPDSSDCYCAVKNTVGACATSGVEGFWLKGGAVPLAGKISLLQLPIEPNIKDRLCSARSVRTDRAHARP